MEVACFALGAAGCALVALLVAVGGGVVWVGRRRGAGRRGGGSALAALGYQQAGPGRWTRAVDGVVVAFGEGRDGPRWEARLPRYHPWQLAVDERGEPWPPPPPAENVFLAGDPDLDLRFRFRSPSPAGALPLLAADDVAVRLFDIPVVSVVVEGDEVVVTDPGGGMLRDADGIRERIRVHEKVARLIVALARHRG
jgi:hypothetical protein